MMRCFVIFLSCSVKSVTFVSSWVVKNTIQSQVQCVTDTMITYNNFTNNNGLTIQDCATTNIEPITHSQLMGKTNSYLKTPVTISARDAPAATSAASASAPASPPPGLLYPLLPWSGNFTVANPSPGVTGAPLSSYGTSARVITTSAGSQTLLETFAIATLTNYSGLISTVTMTTLDVSNSLHSFTVDPGGIYWTPSDPPLPTPYPAKSMVPSTKSTNAAMNTAVKSAQNSNTDAFANNAITETTININGMSYHYFRTSFPDLITITGTTTVTTSVVHTNKDDSRSTISAAVVVVGPHGVWYVHSHLHNLCHWVS